jgi:hypothetical protein
MGLAIDQSAAPQLTGMRGFKGVRTTCWKVLAAFEARQLTPTLLNLNWNKALLNRAVIEEAVRIQSLDEHALHLLSVVASHAQTGAGLWRRDQKLSGDVDCAPFT